MKIKLTKNIKYKNNIHKIGEIVTVPKGMEEQFKQLGDVVEAPKKKAAKKAPAEEPAAEKEAEDETPKGK